MRNFSTLIGFAALLGACTIDASTESEDAPVYEVTYTAPEAASWVSMCDNFESTWSCGPRLDGRVASWSGDLDAVRLCNGPDEGGYLVNFNFSVDPHWALGQDGSGGFAEVGELHVAGPLTFAAVSVDNGLDGGNYWLAGADCD